MTADDGSASFLAALQLADSFFPSGAYAHSQGLEGMVTRGWVRNADDLGKYLHNLLVWSILPCDGVALLNGHLAARDGDLATLADIDRHLHTMKLPEELRQASCHAGRRILDETAPLVCGRAGSAVHGEFRQLVLQRSTPGTGAVALGVASYAAGIAGRNRPVGVLPQLCRGRAGRGPTDAAADPFRGSAHPPCAAWARGRFGAGAENAALERDDFLHAPGGHRVDAARTRRGADVRQLTARPPAGSRW